MSATPRRSRTPTSPSTTCSTPTRCSTICDEFEAIPEATWTNYLHLNERKFGHTDVHHWGPTLQALRDELSSERFVSFVSEVTGIPDLHADDVMDGGGLHRSLPGGFLNMHSDFSAHHSKPGWRRRVNLLLYLNPEWQPEWGGALELWSKDMQRCVTRVEPKANRILLFTTDADSFHGHPEPLRFPRRAGPAVAGALLLHRSRTTWRHHATNYRRPPRRRRQGDPHLPRQEGAGGLRRPEAAARTCLGRRS